MTTRKEFDAAFTDAVNRLRDSWVAWTAHRVGDRDAAEDIVENALTRAWVKRDSFASRGTLDAWDALVALPKQQFLVTCYRLVLGYSTRDTATQLRVSEGTVKATLHAAKRRLRYLLAG